MCSNLTFLGFSFLIGLETLVWTSPHKPGPAERSHPSARGVHHEGVVAAVDRWFIPLLMGFSLSKVMQDFATIRSMSGPSWDFLGGLTGFNHQQMVTSLDIYIYVYLYIVVI